MNFQTWWRDIGSKMRPIGNEDHAEHAERVARAAWNDARANPVKALQDIKKHYETVFKSTDYRLATIWNIANKALEDIE